MRSKRPSHSAWKRFRFRLEILAVSVFGCLLRCLPRHLVRRFGEALGRLAYRFDQKQQRLARTNLDVAFGDTLSSAEKDRLARESFANAVGTLTGLLWMPRLNPSNFRQYVEVDAATLDRVGRLKARGKGLLFITPHYGDWEMLGQASAYYGFPLTTITEDMSNLVLRQRLDAIREHSGNTMIGQHFATAKMLRALKRGHCVAMLIDLNAIPQFGGVWLNFFGLPVFNHATAAILALRTGAAVVGSVAHPLPGGRARIECSEDLSIQPTGNEAEDIRELSQRCSDFCEQMVRAHPENWLWAYKRWKFRPSPEQGRYPFYSFYRPQTLRKAVAGPILTDTPAKAAH